MPERSMLEWLLIGALLGVVLRLLAPKRDPDGFTIAVLVGMVGAILGGSLARVIGPRIGGGAATDIAAAVGAIALLAVYRLILARRTA